MHDIFVAIFMAPSLLKRGIIDANCRLNNAGDGSFKILSVGWKQRALVSSSFSAQ
jgi:hypothetical protein